MAAAHLSGAAALLRAHFPGDNYRQIINRIYAGVDLLPGLVGKCATGGRLNLFKALGATPPPLPTVTVTATDANAAESGDTGSFTISRTGSTAAALVVNYSMGGTAGNGTDYQTLPGLVIIAVGSSTASITVTPIDDTTVESNETAVLTLAASSAYTVGSPNNATIIIADNDSGPPNQPVVTLSEFDPSASETGPDVGVIYFHRTGDVSQPLTVNWAFSGTAANGSDSNNCPPRGRSPQARRMPI